MIEIPKPIAYLFDFEPEELENKTALFLGHNPGYIYSSHLFRICCDKSINIRICCLPTSISEIFTIKNNNDFFIFISEGYFRWLNAISASHTFGIIFNQSKKIDIKLKKNIIQSIQNAVTVCTILDTNSSLPDIVEYIPQQAIYLYYSIREIFYTFSIAHELSHVILGHLPLHDIYKNEIEADREAVEITKNIGFSITFSARILQILIMNLYYRFHLHKIKSDSYPRYTTRAENIANCFTDIKIGHSLQLLNDLIDDIDNNGILFKGADPNFSAISNKCIKILDLNFNKLINIFKKDESVIDVCSEYQKQMSIISSQLNSCIITKKHNMPYTWTANRRW